MELYSSFPKLGPDEFQMAVGGEPQEELVTYGQQLVAQLVR